jgi:ribonuclease T1
MSAHERVMSRIRRRFLRPVGALVAALVLSAVAWLGISGPQARGVEEAAPGIPWVDFSALPREAHETLALIRAGGPFPHRQDGTVFQNRERILPNQPKGYYTEYTVRTPGASNRGARRIVAGGDPKASAEFYYTEDHYSSFRRIREVRREGVQR